MPKLEALDRDGLGATSRRSRNTPESTPQRSRVEIPAAGKRDVRISAPPPSILAAFDQARRSATIPFGPPEQRGASKLPSTSDLLDVPHSHHVADRICAEIDDLLNEKINRDPDDKSVMDALRRTKFELPEAYTGKPNLEVFLRWVNDFVSWASNSNLVGPQFDRRPIDVLGSNLREAAADWFYTEVSSGSRSKRDWTFRSVLFGLYDRFIPRTARAQAIDDFNRCNYSSDRGIVDFWSRLRVMASRMPVYPDSYTLARRFLSGLPMNILEYITVTRGLSAEDSSIEELLRAARDVESSLQMLRLHNPNAPKPQALSESSSDGTSPLSVVPTSDIPELSQHDQNRQSTTPAVVSSPSSSSAPDSSRSHATRVAVPTSIVRESRGGQPKLDPTKAQCYACGTYGHISSDPKCPKYRGVRLHMVRVLTGDELHPDNDGIQAGNTSESGSYYDSEPLIDLDGDGFCTPDLLPDNSEFPYDLDELAPLSWVDHSE